MTESDGIAPSVEPMVDRGPQAPAPHPSTVRLQILTTEHWSLLASRGLAWNELFSRAGMYLSTLSGAMVALGLIAGIDRFGDTFAAFALVALPGVLFVGLATFIRMGAVNYHDAMTVTGMNRIRGAYLELAPDLAPYFVMGTHDDARGIAITMALPPNTSPLVHVIAATPFLVTVLNGVVAGAIVAIGASGVLAFDRAATIAVARGYSPVPLVCRWPSSARTCAGDGWACGRSFQLRLRMLQRSTGRDASAGARQWAGLAGISSIKPLASNPSQSRRSRLPAHRFAHWPAARFRTGRRSSRTRGLE